MKYQDTSTGQVVAEHRTRLGACTTMAQNLHNAVIHLGHQNGAHIPSPCSQILTKISRHRNPLDTQPPQAGCPDPLAPRARYECEREPACQKGYLGVVAGGSMNVYHPPHITTSHVSEGVPLLYLTHPIPHQPLSSLRFEPFSDVCVVGHTRG